MKKYVVMQPNASAKLSTILHPRDILLHQRAAGPCFADCPHVSSLWSGKKDCAFQFLPPPDWYVVLCR